MIDASPPTDLVDFLAARFDTRRGGLHAGTFHEIGGSLLVMSLTSVRARIVIADSQPIFRDGLRRLLETDPSLKIVGETRGGAATAALVRGLRADILLLGLDSVKRESLPALEVPATLEEIHVRTILLTDSVQRADVTLALATGARGLIPKDSTPEVLFDSIRCVMDGGYWVGRDRVSETSISVRKLELARRQSRAFGLTRREIEIIRAVIAGCTNREIATRSAISENTVKSHLAHIFNKLGASNRVELALFAAHHRLLDGV